MMRYFNKIFILLMLTWGAVGLERLVAGFVLTGIQKDFSLNYTQAGAVIAMFGLAWAIGTWAMGSLSDYAGRKPVLVFLIIFGGVCSWLTGLAWSFAALLIIRAVMGFADGGIFGPASATVTEESPPLTRARNAGMLPALFTLVGAAIGPILSTQLMAHYGWRFAFYIYAIPAVVLGLLIWVVMKEPESTRLALAARRAGKQRATRLDGEGKEIGYWDVFKYRNILLMTAIWSFVMAFLWIFTSFGTLYMAKVHGLPLTTVGMIMSGIGIGGFFGSPLLGLISDHTGRKKTVVSCLFVSGVAAIIFGALTPGTSVVLLFAFLFIAGGVCGGVCPIMMSVSTETVGFSMAATAIGVVTGFGELIGGGVFPIVGGGIADSIGLSSTLYLSGALLIIGGVCGIFMKETAPRMIAQVEKADILAPAV
jgi:MFS family permease